MYGRNSVHGTVREFLRLLYKGISENPAIESVTIRDYLAQHDSRPLERLFAGSWINHNFAIWIGHPEDNKAWDSLKEADRKSVV